MCRKLYILLLFLSPVYLLAQTPKNVNPNGYNIFYHDNGKKASEGNMVDGKPDGYWKTYNEEGIIKSEGNRKNLQLDSVWKFYDAKGNLAFAFTYKEGKKNGPKYTYDTKDNVLQLKESYVNDIKEGNTISYYKTGKTKEVIPFVGGKENGNGYELSPDSVLITLTTYKMGFIQRTERINRKDNKGLKQGMWKEFYPSGTIKSEVTYRDDKMDGYLKEYSANGSLLNTTKYINGILQQNPPELAKLDIKYVYHDNGNIKFSATYKDGVMEGIQREFSPEGKVIAAKVYSEGFLIGEGVMDTAGMQQGPWIEYYPGGQVKSKGEYINNMRIGEWIFYYSNGKVEQKGKYDNKGKAQGIWKWFYESGNIWREESYKNNKREGQMTEYDDNGKIITQGEFVGGEREGPWMLQLADYREEGNYVADKRDGEWKHYYVSNNKLRYVGKYIDGVPDGVQTYYYENGQVKQVGKYVGGMKEGDWRFYDEAGFIFLTINFKNDIEMKFDGVKVVPETPTIETTQ